MFCMQCGTQLPDEANFCIKCGLAQRQAVVPQTNAIDQWEICEILYTCVQEKWGIIPKDVIQFIAMAKGFNGEYQAAASKSFELTGFQFDGPSGKSKRHTTALEELIELLTQEGWEPLSDKGPNWFSRKFRRKASEKTLT
jgi:hypothetical protein